MAEAIATLGVVASCIDILRTINEIRTFAQQNIHSNSSAKKELVPLLGRLTAYEGLLRGIKYEVETDDADATRLTALCYVDGPLQACSTAVCAIRDRMKSLPKHVVFGKIIDKDISRAMQSLEDSKPILELALHADQRVLTKAIEEFVTSIHSQVVALRQDHADLATLVEDQLEKTQAYIRETDAQDKELREQTIAKNKRQEVLAWLSPLDPSINLRAAMKPVHTEAKTGQWFLTGEEFSKWRDGKLPYLWLHGLSGSGKTTLISSVISAFKQSLVSAGTDSLVAYFFFEFGPAGKDGTETMIRSFLLQLAIQDATLLSLIETIYGNFVDGESDKMQDDDQKTWSEDLIAFLAKNNKDHDGQRHVYFLVDAIDECTDPEELATFLEKISAENANSSWLLTSTENASDVLAQDHQFVTVSMEQSAVDRDIQSYVAARLKRDSTLRSYPPDRKRLISEALVSGSAGIFRWVACQLDALGVLRDRRAVTVRKALAQLPKTLNDTYQRILDRLPSDEDRNLVMKVVEFIIFAQRPLIIDEVAEAVVYKAGMAQLSPDDRFDNPADIMTLCGSLVALQKDVIVLSHKSVVEFYSSWKPKQNEENDLDDEVSAELGKMCLNYISMAIDDKENLKSTDSRPPKPNAQRLKELELQYPLLDYACSTWDMYLIECKNDVLKPTDLEVASKLRIRGETTLWKAWLMLQRADIWDNQVTVAIIVTEALRRCSSAADWIAGFWSIRRAFRTQSETNKPSGFDSGQAKKLHLVANVSMAECSVRETYGEIEPLRYNLGICLAEIALQRPLFGYRLAYPSEISNGIPFDESSVNKKDGAAHEEGGGLKAAKEREVKEHSDRENTDVSASERSPEAASRSRESHQQLDRDMQIRSYRTLIDALFPAIADRMGHIYASAVRRCAKGDKTRVTKQRSRITNEVRVVRKTHTLLDMVADRLHESHGLGYRVTMVRAEAKRKADAETVKARFEEAMREEREEERIVSAASRWQRPLGNDTHFFNSVPGGRGAGRDYAARTTNTYIPR